MKEYRWIYILGLVFLLSSCGKHGYEGEYSVSGPDGFEEMASMFLADEFVLGTNYIEANGSRNKFDKIFVRASGSRSYLVFKDGEIEEAWEIIDKDTLIQGISFMQIKYSKIK